MVDASNPHCSSVDGVLCNKDKTALIEYPGGKAGSYSVPASVTDIERWAFSGCANLTSITIPSSVTDIGEEAFGKCSNITGFYFQGNAPRLYVCSGAFNGTTNATIYYRPDTKGWSTNFGGRPTKLWKP